MRAAASYVFRPVQYEESENTVGESSAPVPLDTTDDYEGAESGDN